MQIFSVLETNDVDRSHPPIHNVQQAVVHWSALDYLSLHFQIFLSFDDWMTNLDWRINDVDLELSVKATYTLKLC